MKEYFNTVSVLVYSTGEKRTWEVICSKRGLTRHIRSRIRKWGHDLDDCYIQIESQRDITEELKHSISALERVRTDTTFNDLYRMGLIAHYAKRIERCMYMLNIYEFDEIKEN